MSDSKFGNSADAKKDGWHSRRHETRAAQDAARERYQQKTKPAAKINRRQQGR